MAAKSGAIRKKSGVIPFHREMRRNWPYYMMIMPALLLLIAFAYVPMPGLIIAFQDYNLLDGFRSRFIGLKNFMFYFTSDYAVRTTFNTLYLNALYLLTTNVASIALAIMLNELRGRLGKKFYQNAMFLPYFFSVIIVSHIVAKVVFSDGMGIANQIIALFGGDPVVWSTEPGKWPAILVITHIWQAAGYQSIIYLSTITGIDEQLYEAASLDGASRLRQLWHITLPMLVPTVLTLLLLSIGGMLRGDFGLIHNLTTGLNRTQLLKYIDVIDTYVFRAIKTSAEFSIAAAVGLYQSVVGFLLVFGSNALVKRYEKDYALF